MTTHHPAEILGGVGLTGEVWGYILEGKERWYGVWKYLVLKQPAPLTPTFTPALWAWEWDGWMASPTGVRPGSLVVPGCALGTAGQEKHGGLSQSFDLALPVISLTSLYTCLFILVIYMGRLGSLGQEDPLEEGMAIHSNILAWRIPWTEEPGGLQSIGSQRVRHDWATNTFTLVCSYIFSSLQGKADYTEELWATTHFCRAWSMLVYSNIINLAAQVLVAAHGIYGCNAWTL